nr:putative late blight resistance protein homolog R1A-4 [Ipomoea batatas]
MAFDPSVFLQRVLVNVRDLVFLRYLSITQWFEGLDHVVSNNPYLLSLVVSNNESQFGAPPVHLPSSIWEAPQLRHLELGDSYRVDPPSMVKENLQSLSWVVRLIHCRKEVYDKLPNIKKLKISLKDDDIEASHTGGSYSNPIILDYLDYLEALEKLTISISVGCVLTLTAGLVFPSQLKKLRLSGTNLSKRDLTVIGMLPQFTVLKLENAFQGTVWKVSKGGFRRLRFLLLEDIKLKQWEWETCDDDNFPVLEHIVLRLCYSLKQIPGIFKDVFTLKLIVFEECCPSLVASAKKIQYEHWACGDITFEDYTFNIKIFTFNYPTFLNKIKREWHSRLAVPLSMPPPEYLNSEPCLRNPELVSPSHIGCRSSPSFYVLVDDSDWRSFVGGCPTV